MLFAKAMVRTDDFSSFLQNGLYLIDTMFHANVTPDARPLV
jgi:hypothetical protein